MNKIKSKLLPFQIDHVNNLVRILTNNKCVADMSDTGTGKTYSALATCHILKLRPIILCPKSVMSSWKRVSDIFKIKPYFIVNYETAKLCKYYDENRNRIMCPYIIKNPNYGKKKQDKNNSTKKSSTNNSSTNTSTNNSSTNNSSTNNSSTTSSIKKNDEISRYSWENIEENTIFIFDEVHRASNLATHNAQLLFAAKLTQKPIMILSATIADIPEKFRMFFWILNFIDPSSSDPKNLQYVYYINSVMKWLARDNNPMLRIHNMLYPERASRMRIDALGKLFPETQITAEPYSMGKTREEEIEKQYSIISDELNNLEDKAKKDKGNILVKILRAHQKIEILKVPTIVELANDFIENGKCVVIFINFNQTLKLLTSLLNTTVVIHGGQSQEERDNAINMFTENKTNIIICNIKAGGVGISLHDIHGGHPRASIISPPWSSIDLVQALGRIHRAGSKSKSMQRIVYTANTIEEKIAEKLRVKLKNLNTLNDGGVKDLLSQILKPKIL